MTRLALILALFAALGASALAGEVEDRQATIARLERERARLVTSQRGLEQDHQKKLAEADRATRRRAFNAGSKKAEAQETGQKLEKGQILIRQKSEQILTERRALVAALQKAHDANPSDVRITGQLEIEKAKLPAPVKRIRIADERIEPGDYPEDLDAKAARLKKSEAELTQEIARAEDRAHYFKHQALLGKSRRLSNSDLVHDGQKGRKSAHGENRGAASGADRNDATGGAAEPSQDPGGGGAGAGFGDESAPPPSGPAATPAGTSPLPSDVEVDVTTQYRDVIDQTTIDALRQMERSADPEIRAQAAEKLGAALKARAERVKQQRQAIEKRAKQLRGK